ncbi:MAG: HYR domain-containing protein [Acidobacteria bacterium]|nr:HYR domain-containing protein [Acidobacteriota bacterium]
MVNLRPFILCRKEDPLQLTCWGADDYGQVSGPNASTEAFGSRADTDGDGIANSTDDDDDNDGAPDTADAFPLNASESVDVDGTAALIGQFALDASESVDVAVTIDASGQPHVLLQLLSGNAVELMVFGQTHTLTPNDPGGDFQRDVAPPVIAGMADVTAEATSPGGAVVFFEPPNVTDDVDPAPEVTVSPASGSTFALGATTVAVTAVDDAGHRATATFSVTVVDTTPPSIMPPAGQVLEATSPAGATATFEATATDIVTSTPTITYSHAPGNTFPLGSTTVTATATDGSGNTASATFTIAVRDTTAPAITGVSIDAPVLWPPNHEMVDVVMSYQVSDAGDAAPVCSLDVTSNEPVNGTGDGDTSPDWEVIDAHRVRLRAERAGTGSGRIYTVRVTCTDAAGNGSAAHASVAVPKSRGR